MRQSRTSSRRPPMFFEAQLHRRYILGFVLLGKQPDITFFFVFIDRVGLVATVPVLLNDFNSFILARVVFALTFASDSVLGMDPLVTFDRFTGKPLTVMVEDKKFTVITQIFCISLSLQSRHSDLHCGRRSWKNFTFSKTRGCNQTTNHRKSTISRKLVAWWRRRKGFRRFFGHSARGLSLEITMSVARIPPRDSLKTAMCWTHSA